MFFIIIQCVVGGLGLFCNELHATVSQLYIVVQGLYFIVLYIRIKEGTKVEV